MIIESIITTIDSQGAINFAPMGVEWGGGAHRRQAVPETTTFRNIRQPGGGRQPHR